METVGQGYSQFIRFLDLFRNVYIAKAVIVLAIYNALKPCFSPFVSNIAYSNWLKYQSLSPEDCLLGGNMFIWFPNLPQGDCLPRRSLFMRSLNLPPGDCLPRLQPVSQPT